MLHGLRILAVAAMVVLVAACTGTPEENALKRTVAVELAIDRIDRFNALGVDPIQLDERKLLALDTACVLVQLLGVEAGIDVETLKTIGAACEVIRLAAAPARAVAEDPTVPAPEVAPATDPAS